MSLFEWFELISVLAGLLAVWLNAKQNILGWPIGLVNILLAALVYWHSKLFGECALQGFFAVSSVYGWFIWKKLHQNLDGKRHKPITTATFSELIYWLFGGFLSTVGCYMLLSLFTNGDLIWVDSLITAFSLVAQLMMARKIIQNWLIWILVDIMAAGVYYYKELYFMSVEFVIFCGLALWGFQQWKKEQTL